MPDREDILKEQTFKGQCDTADQRVYYTLSAGTKQKLGNLTPVQLELWLHKTSKTLALLIAHLEQAGKLTEEQLDDILFQVAQ